MFEQFLIEVVCFFPDANGVVNGDRGWWKKKVSGEDNVRILPSELVKLLKRVASDHTKEGKDVLDEGLDLRWLARFRTTVNREQLQFDHVSCPTFAIRFALARGSEGQDLDLESFVKSMRGDIGDWRDEFVKRLAFKE